MSFSESNLIYNLYLEGAAEDMLNVVLTKSNATPEEKDFFLVKDGGSLLFKKSADVPILLKWIREENASMNDVLVKDYKNYLKFLSNTPLSNFDSYLKWTTEVHGAVGRAEYESRNKNLKDIDITGEDKENVLANDEDVLILKGDDEHKCVRYGKGYSFCISRPLGGNMYGNYRLSKASTFYFIYFKKVPKEDERHIMVLDRTNEGWEWTFGKNQTRVINGGWNEVIGQFPVLAKYESLFVNKPLTEEEKVYQQRLRTFVSSPSLEKFNKFSYQEKADVLKFGMLIPLDVFESLDKKFLRNEWISVGPKMSDPIFNKLTDKEKERFFSVRKVQLSQREPEDKYDVEIVKKDPELYEKYVKPEEELVKEQQKLISKKVETDLLFENEYILPDFSEMEECKNLILRFFKLEISLPQLQKSGYIAAESATSLNLPQLQESENIYAPKATSLSLPQLQKSGYIYAHSVTSLSLPQLQQSEDIDAPKATNLSLPQLQKSGDIDTESATSLSLPQLQQSGNIAAPKATNLSLPQLQQSRYIAARLATSLSLPQLQQSRYINARSATSLSLPQLQQSGNIDAPSAISLSLPKLNWSENIYARSAKKIKISSKLKSKLIDIPEDCKIIEPSSEEELNDSTIYDLMKSFLLRS